MNAWQIELMVANAASEEWELINEPDPYEKYLKDAAKDIKEALRLIDEGLDTLDSAVSTLCGTPMADKLQSFLDAFDDLSLGLKSMKDHYERGERE